MSLYYKTKEEIYSFITNNYNLSEEVKKKIKDGFIDGEVLYELNDDDFKNLGFTDIQIVTLKFLIDKEKKEKSIEKPSIDDLIKKLKLMGINEPSLYLNLNIEEAGLKIGQEKILKKYKEIFDLNSINKYSSSTEISNFFRDNLKISEESIEALKNFTGEFIFSMLENVIPSLKLKKEDEIKILNFTKKIKEENAQKEGKIEKISTNIEKKIKLDDMIIYEEQDKKITMKLLYDKLMVEKKNILMKNKDNPISQSNFYKLSLIEQISAKIIKIEKNLFFDFLIGKSVENKILIEPLKTKIKKNDSSFDIDIISLNQLEFIIESQKLISPKIYCKKCKKSYSCNIFSLIKHKECQDTSIYEPNKFFELKTEKEFKNFFPELNKIEFINPSDFDINFENYFNKNKDIKMNNNFVYYEDIDERNLMSTQLIELDVYGKFLVFYGFPGIGKSITALHVLKYEINHEKIKTLYIHCKHISLLNENYKYSEIKNILLYEIPFLFYDDFDSYRKCVDIIKYFKFSYSNTYFNLIDEIFSYLIEKPNKYLIVFDQYNQSIDPKEKIKNIEKRILEDKDLSAKFCFCHLLSLNNKDVKQMKIEQLLGITNDDQMIVFEVKKIICDKSFIIPKKEEIYNKLGKTIKIYNELFDIYEEDELNDYYIKKKKKIKKNLIDFYNNPNKDDELQLLGMINLMKFSIDIQYTKEEIKNLVDFIHFKYFDIQQKGDFFIVSYFYPAVEEVMKDIYYSFLFNNKNFYDKLLSYRLIKNGGLGPCFEQIIVCNLTPPDPGYNRLIPNLLINKKKTIPYFIPKITEVNIPIIKKIRLENNNIYLIDQEIFGGKSLDFIIIDCKKNEQIIYSFQASTLKDEIFKEEEIKKILKQMNAYISKNFFQNLKVNEDNLYFGYIFSKINEKKNAFNSMISTCNKNQIAYSYFVHKENIFITSKKKEIKSIYDLVYNPFNQKPFLTFKIKFPNKKRYVEIHKSQNFKIKEEIKEKIIKILKMIYHKEITIIDFQECLEKQYLIHFLYDFYFTQDTNGNSFFVIHYIDEFEVYSLDNIINNSNIYSDYLLNDNCKYDCYFIYSEGEKKKEPLYKDREKFLFEVVEPEKEKKEKI